MHRKNLESFVVIRSKDVVVVDEYFLCILTACKCGRFRIGRSIDGGRGIERVYRKSQDSNIRTECRQKKKKKKNRKEKKI